MADPETEEWEPNFDLYETVEAEGQVDPEATEGEVDPELIEEEPPPGGTPAWPERQQRQDGPAEAESIDDHATPQACDLAERSNAEADHLTRPTAVHPDEHPGSGVEGGTQTGRQAVTDLVTPDTQGSEASEQTVAAATSTIEARTADLHRTGEQPSTVTADAGPSERDEVDRAPAIEPVDVADVRPSQHVNEGSAPRRRASCQPVRETAAEHPITGSEQWERDAQPHRESGRVKPVELAAAKEASRGPFPFLVDPGLVEAVDRATKAVDLAAYVSSEIEARVQRIDGLVDRIRRIRALRDRSDLIEELDHLDLSDPSGCLRTVAIVLAEALGKQPIVPRREPFDKWIRALSKLADEAERFRPEVKVVAGVDDKIDGHATDHAAAGVEVRDSDGVTWGAHNQVDVTHLCVVERPVIEIADLIDIGPDGPLFNWSAWRYTGSGDSGTVSVQSSSLREGYWTNIWNCRGVTIGDRNSVNVTYVYRMSSCRVNLAAVVEDLLCA